MSCVDRLASIPSLRLSRYNGCRQIFPSLYTVFASISFQPKLPVLHESDNRVSREVLISLFHACTDVCHKLSWLFDKSKRKNPYHVLMQENKLIRARLEALERTANKASTSSDDDSKQ